MELRLSRRDSFVPTDKGRWRLAPRSLAGRQGVEVAESPFVIGRAPDCHIILPESDDYRTVTSRWHCHLKRSEEGWLVLDGGPIPHPDTGKPKPSVSGTLVNGRRIDGPARIKVGDALEVGPWRMEVHLGETGEQGAPEPPKEAKPPPLIEEVAKGSARELKSSDPKIIEQFGQLHELVQRLARMPDIEESMTALLSYATNKIPGAEVAAILVADDKGEFTVRLAWEEGFGRMPEFEFSSSLLRDLPPDKSFLLQAEMKDPTQSQVMQKISSGLLVPIWGKGQRLGVLYMDNRRRGATTFTETDLFIGSALASLISLQMSLEKQADATRVKENMARYFSPDVVQRIVERSARGGGVGLEVQEKDITVMFTDLEGFTELSRKKTPAEIGEILNPYLETVADCIQEAGGHVNKFIGDAVMGIFGAQPGTEGIKPAEAAAQAVRAALKIPGAWNKAALKRDVPVLRMRIGLNSGRAVVGNIGYARRLEYSVLGDAVNVASRMEKFAFPNRAAASEATYNLTKREFEFEDMGEKEVKGVGRLRVYAPVGPIRQPEPSNEPPLEDLARPND